MRTCRQTPLLIAGAIALGALLLGSCGSDNGNTEQRQAGADYRSDAFTPSHMRATADTTSPTISAVSVYEIVRGQPENSGHGRIFLTVSTSDDKTPAGQCEYRLAVIGGQLPEGFVYPTGSIYSKEYFAEEQPLEMITLRWNDGPDRAQDAFDFQMMLYAVDRSGNTSPPSDTIRVAHSGRYIDIEFRFGVLASSCCG